MKLQIFQGYNKKKNILVIGSFFFVFMLAVIFVYRTYSIYQEKREYNLIGGSVPNQDYDVRFAFLLEDVNGNQTSLRNVPDGKKYSVKLQCNQGANGYWDYERWGPVVEGLSTSQTKCSIIFGPYRPLITYGIDDILSESGSGLYEVTHDDAEITYTDDVNVQNILKKTEYRYAGSNPNNYVTFNGEKAGWRLIGLVNTPEGQRIKLIRDESIGEYSWDSSESSVDNGYGVNEWSQADLMTLLNNGPYYNRASGTCYNQRNNASIPCDFSANGLMNESKEMIDTITWNTGSWNTSLVENDDEVRFSSSCVKGFYNLERSNYTGKQCTEGLYCNDNIIRTIVWKGQIGLMYPSDYGYATSGGSTMNRQACDSISLIDGWSVSEECYINDWLYKENEYRWTISPNAYSGNANGVFHSYQGRVTGSGSRLAYAILPSLYLKSNIKIIDGDGTRESPYELGV